MGELVAFGNPELMTANFCGACDPVFDRDADVADFAKRFAIDRQPAREKPRLTAPIRRTQRSPDGPGAVSCGDAFKEFRGRQGAAWKLIWLSTQHLSQALFAATVRRSQVRREMPDWAIMLAIFCGGTSVSFLSIIATCWMRGI